MMTTDRAEHIAREILAIRSRVYDQCRAERAPTNEIEPRVKAAIREYAERLDREGDTEAAARVRWLHLGARD